MIQKKRLSNKTTHDYLLKQFLEFDKLNEFSNYKELTIFVKEHSSVLTGCFMLCKIATSNNSKFEHPSIVIYPGKNKIDSNLYTISSNLCDKNVLLNYLSVYKYEKELKGSQDNIKTALELLKKLIKNNQKTVNEIIKENKQLTKAANDYFNG